MSEINDAQSTILGLAGKFRQIASGSTAVNAGANVVLSLFTRNAGERVMFFAWIVEDSATDSIWTFEGFNTVDAGSIRLRFSRTANANEAELSARNITVSNRNVDWVVLGYTP